VQQELLTTKFYLADPIISIALAFFMLPRTWSIMKKAVHILMEGSPANVSHEEVKKAILQMRGVTGVFELHIWTITSGMNALSAHIVVIDPSKSQVILQEINSILEKKFKITHATIQIERYHSDSGAV
jgi:cobalt-zinc-cadmium efflux system protein